MARLASIEKAGYFPCPTAVVKALVHHHIRLHPWTVAPTYILDPCAGEGSAVHTFAQALTSLPTSAMASHHANMAKQCQRRIHVRAVELDAERAQAAKALLGETNVLHAAIESVSAVGQFGIVWLNPPYDQVAGGRAELAWVRMCAPFVGESGMLVLIVPDMFVETGRYKKEMTNALYQAGFGSSLVLRFPDPEYEPFKQVAILASRPVSSNNYAYRNIDLQVAGVIGQCQRTHTHIIRTYDTTPTLTRVIRAELPASIFEADQPAAVADLLGDPTGNASAMRPLAPVRSEHAAMVAAAGLFNGAVVGQKIIKGTTIKRVLTTTKQSVTEVGTQVTEEIEAEVLAAQLTTIDMCTAAIEVVNSIDHKERFEALLEAHAAEFVDLAKRLYPPVFTPDDMGRYEEALSHIHAPRVIKGQQNGMFPPQAFRAGAILDGWRRHKVVTMVGEMGVGKAQPLDAKVLTPTGWTTMGDIQVGDEVVNPAGGTARVIGVYPQGELPIYEIEFSDGSKTRCCDNHLWLVNSPLRKWRGRPERVVPLWWIRMSLAHANGTSAFRADDAAGGVRTARASVGPVSARRLAGRWWADTANADVLDD